MIKTQGFSLIEIMLSITLALFLSLAAIKLWLVVKEHTESLQQTQDNAQRLQLAKYYIMRASYRAGFAMCEHYSHYFGEMSLEVTEDNVLVIRYIQPIAYLAHNMVSHDSTLLLDQPIQLQTNTQYMLSNCQHEDIFTLTNKQRTDTISQHPDFNIAYPQHSLLGEVVNVRFWIAKTTRVTPRKEKIYALYQQINSQSKQELVEGIDAMRIEAVNTQHQQLSFTPAINVHDWQTTRLIHITLIASNHRQLAFMVGLRNHWKNT
tara:strand:+ start:892 stop:1680 length:789 start_codon:yes stop_codon:yes gene_type:complete